LSVGCGWLAVATTCYNLLWRHCSLGEECTSAMAAMLPENVSLLGLPS
jgi:hypothetical protein